MVFSIHSSTAQSQEYIGFVSGLSAALFGDSDRLFFPVTGGDNEKDVKTAVTFDSAQSGQANVRACLHHS
jgi:hypothetical protein